MSARQCSLSYFGRAAFGSSTAHLARLRKAQEQGAKGNSESRRDGGIALPKIGSIVTAEATAGHPCGQIIIGMKARALEP